MLNEDDLIIAKFFNFDINVGFDYKNDYNQIFRIIDKLEELGFTLNYHKIKQDYHIFVNKNPFKDMFQSTYSVNNNRNEALYQCCLKAIKYLLEHKNVTK